MHRMELTLIKECGSTHIEELQKYVIGNKLDIGFAYDGDADRCLCVDEKGNVVNGDFNFICCRSLYETERNSCKQYSCKQQFMSKYRSL